VSWGDAAAILGGLAAGLLSGTFGVGGGILFVPIMTSGYGFTQALAQGTSLAAIIPTAVVGGLTHIRQGNVLREAAIWMGVGGVGGAVLGALVAVHVPGGILARFFALFLFANAFVVVRGAFVRQDPPAPPQ
jgi:uncharacterized membrane protein YfcA